MRRSSFLVAFATLATALPLSAQDGNVAIAHFITIDVKDMEAVEESIRDHNQWHAQQNDTWTWGTYQAFGGGTEYAIVSANHTWADLDNPSVDMSADAAEWASSDAAELTTGDELWIWENLPDISNAPPEPMAIVNVLEFQVHGDEEDLLLAAGKFREAAGDGAYYQWARVMSNDKPLTYFVAVWANTFEELGAPGPTPIEILRAQHGVAMTNALSEAFGSAATNTSNRIWVFRPDLSYIPG